MTNTIIDNLVNERSMVVVFWTCQIHIAEVSANTNDSLFLVHGDGFGYPHNIHDWIDETNFAQIFDLDFVGRRF